MRPIEELCAEVDAALAQFSMTRTHDGYIARKYAGTLDAQPLRAGLSVFTDPNQTTLKAKTALGYQLSFELDNGLETRWALGEQIPWLVGRGLARVAHVTPKAPLLADDPAWAERLLTNELKPACARLAQGATFAEQRPGVLQLQIRQMQSTALPELAPLMEAFASVARASARPPSPRPVTPRLSDKRGLVVALIAVATIVTLTTCLVLGFWFAG
jgi:hypothetical protein